MGRLILYLTVGLTTAAIAAPNRRLETPRLAYLRESLRAVVASPQIDEKIEQITREIDLAEGELRAPFGDAGRAEFEEYRHAQLLERATTSAATWAMLRDVNARLARAVDATAEEQLNLREWRSKLEQDLLAREEPVPTESAASPRQVRLRAARAEVERRIADLRADLRFWSEQKSGAGQIGRARRTEALRRQIEDEERMMKATR